MTAGEAGPLDPIRMATHRNGAKVRLHLTATAVRTSEESGVRTDGTEQQVLISRETEAAESQVLPGTGTELSHALKGARGEGGGGSQGRPGGADHLHRPIQEGGGIRAAVPGTRDPARRIEARAIERITEGTVETNCPIAVERCQRAISSHAGHLEVRCSGVNQIATGRISCC